MLNQPLHFFMSLFRQFFGLFLKHFQHFSKITGVSVLTDDAAYVFYECGLYIP